INYRILGMLLLEEAGAHFTKRDLHALWFRNIPAGWQWGPERTMNAYATVWSLGSETPDGEPWEEWVEVLNPGDEQCGALIRADAYGYACPGHPALAAELAWRDASYSHRRTGIYGTMFCAAALATAFVVRDPMEIFEVALKFVPQRSRFAEVVRDSLAMIRGARDWLDGYDRVHGKYRQYDHCLVYQEIGTVINTLRFAKDAGEGICLQVSQGNDTDSFGATAGSLLGALHGPGSLEPRWLAPLNDTIHTTVAGFHEQRLSAVAKRMSELPLRLVRSGS
ncbi:MAG TPA: ADP-ribosylglycohydrolase family protein, partial [Candidatus Synoicihabitans sp.]|nr:ADP-ribosylglycohydrolase family protein [Candidatus Synoicihabitans sp.]